MIVNHRRFLDCARNDNGKFTGHPYRFFSSRSDDLMTAKKWRRLICLVLCAALLLPALASAETTKVAAYLLRLREKPSADGKVLDAYPRGTVVTILKKGEEWTKVRVRDKVGYMKTSMLAYSRKEKEAEEEEKKSSEDDTRKKSGDSTMYVMKGVRLNLREEPNADSDVIASFLGGTAVTVLKRGKYWTRVSVKGLEGYMGSNYLVDGN